MEESLNCVFSRLLIPEVPARKGWESFVEVLDPLLPKRPQATKKVQFAVAPSLDQHKESFLKKKPDSRSYLQVAALPQWNSTRIQSSFNKHHVMVNFEDAVLSSHNFTRCLVGSFGVEGIGNLGASKIQEWANRKWSIPGGVTVKELEDNRFLFILPSKEIASQILAKDHFIDGNYLFLDVWHSWACCARRGWNQRSVWIKVMGLPTYLRDINVLRSIGNFCGGFQGIEEGWRSTSNYKWVRIKIKGDGRLVPASVPLLVGQTMYDCPIWVERRPWLDWFDPLSINGVFRQSGEQQKVARGYCAASLNDPTLGSRKDSASQKAKARNPKRLSENKKVTKWVRVGEASKETNYQVGHSSFKKATTLDMVPFIKESC